MSIDDRGAPLILCLLICSTIVVLSRFACLLVVHLKNIQLANQFFLLNTEITD